MVQLVNLTPHAIVLRDEDGEDTIVLSAGLARVSMQQGEPEVVLRVPVPVYGAYKPLAVTGLPDPQTDTLYIVSVVVAAAVAGTRNDVVYPGTGPNDGAIREEGKIVAVTRLIRA